MQNFGRYANLSQYIAPAQPLQIITGVNWGYIRIINNSPYMLSLNFAGIGSFDFPEFFLEDIAITPAYRGSFTVAAISNLTNISSGTSNLLSVNAYLPGEVSGPQSQPLSNPAVTTTASGKPIFSTTVGFGNTATIHQTLNVFNPPTSGVNMTFHSARVFTSDSAKGNLGYLTTISGADLNLGTPVPSVCHSLNATPPVSVAHCTAEDLLVVHGGTDIEGLDTIVGETVDFLDFPDVVILAPGNNLRVVMSGSAINAAVRLTLKWSEDIYTPAIGGVNLGTIVNQIINDGNPLMQIVEATKKSDTPSDVIINNDGSAFFNGIITAPGGIKVNQIRDDVNGNLAMDLSAGDGSVSFPVKVKLIVGSLTRIAITGANPVAVAGTSIAHGLGAIPDFVIPINDAGGSAANSYAINFGTMTTTNVTVYATLAGASTRLLSIKL